MQAKIKAFISLQLLGALCFFLVTITAAFSSRVKRYATWYSFCVSWIISSLSYSLLLIVDAYAGAQGFHRDSHFDVGSMEWKAKRACTVQAALVYATPVLTGFTSLAMCIHVLLYVRAALRVPMSRVKTVTTTMLVVGPYVIWVAMFVVLFQLGQAQPNAVQLERWGYYCHLALPQPVAVCSSIAILASITVAIVETWMAIAVHKYRDALPRTTHPMTFTLRVLLFGFVDLFALIVGLLLLIPSTRKFGANFLLSLIPVLGISIFGSQTDILRVWMFWKKSPSETASLPTSASRCSNYSDDFTFRQPSLSGRRGRWRSSSSLNVSSHLQASNEHHHHPSLVTSNSHTPAVSVEDDTMNVDIEKPKMIFPIDKLNSIDEEDCFDSNDLGAVGTTRRE
ncbi:hypothetical protein F5877DRAFT_75696 [Lentinula edodes]|nr:hypothetical protein F5877DRAFT_75696 [Lentinula edodes]